MKIGAVLLSAGDSSQAGGQPLMELGKKHLLERVTELFRDVGVEAIVAVTGHRKKEVRAAAERLGIKTIHNKEYDSGIYSSVCAGVKQMKQTKRLDAFFILPVTIPLIRPATIKTLIQQKKGDSVVYPTFLKERGHPPLIPVALIPAILKYSGKGGLKTLLEKYSSRDVPVWDKGIVMEADSQKDLAKLKARLSQMDIGSREEARALSQLSMQKRGQDHGMAVADIACKLGIELNRTGYELDIDLLYNSGLLHDIAKGTPHHEEKGAEMLRSLGLSRLAPIVSAHRDREKPKTGKLTEKELVCLADKLVRGTNRMSVKARFTEKLELYSKNSEACNTMKKRLANVKELERIVVERLGRTIEDVLK